MRIPSETLSLLLFGVCTAVKFRCYDKAVTEFFRSSTRQWKAVPKSSVFVFVVPRGHFYATNIVPEYQQCHRARLTDTGTRVVILIRNSVINTGSMSSTITGSATSPVSSLQRDADRCQHSHCADVQRLPFPRIIFLSFNLTLFIECFLVCSSPITAPQSGQLSPPVWPQACRLFPVPVALLAQVDSYLGCFFRFWLVLVHTIASLDPLYHFGSFGSLIPSTNSPRDAASIYRHRQDFLMECFSGLHGVLPQFLIFRINRIYL